VNECSGYLNARVKEAFRWERSESIEWRSPLAGDSYAEYYDEEFLKRLGVDKLKVPLSDFWPRSGPRWDALGRTKSGKLILVEAKAYIEECVDVRSKASDASRKQIQQALSAAKRAFSASKDASWESPCYQYANRLAHLYFLHALNDLDAYLVFLYFADAPDVPSPASEAEWRGASRLVDKALGLGKHRFQNRISTVILSVPEMRRSP
jgi:hypothetical protein